MLTLTLSDKSQVTLPAEMLQHLGLDRGGKVVVEKMPDGRIRLAAARKNEN